MNQCTSQQNASRIGVTVITFGLGGRTVSTILVLAVTAVAVAVVVVGAGVLVRKRACQGVKSQPPHGACAKPVRGLFGRCLHHGRQPRRRVVALLGGPELLRRRTCDRCGRPRVFGRRSSDGTPFLGCSEFPRCVSPRYLDHYVR